MLHDFNLDFSHFITEMMELKARCESCLLTFVDVSSTTPNPKQRDSLRGQPKERLKEVAQVEKTENTTAARKLCMFDCDCHTICPSDLVAICTL